MNNDKFESLSACEKKIETIYLEALDFSLSNENNKNIAITGSYGTGKSTLWNSYSKEGRYRVSTFHLEHTI